jgi:hypothetical protein
VSFIDEFDRSRRDADRIARETWDDWQSMIVSLECEREWDCVSRRLQSQAFGRTGMLLVFGGIRGGGG